MYTAIYACGCTRQQAGPFGAKLARCPVHNRRMVAHLGPPRNVQGPENPAPAFSSEIYSDTPPRPATGEP